MRGREREPGGEASQLLCRRESGEYFVPCRAEAPLVSPISVPVAKTSGIGGVGRGGSRGGALGAEAPSLQINDIHK